MSTQAATIKQFKMPQLAIGRFVARRTSRSAVLWALVFGAYVASKSVGYATAFPTAKARAGVEVLYSNNVGLKVILGTPRHLETVAGFTAWNCLAVITIIGAIWAFLLATKSFRGEEDAGRYEMLLSGQTTARRGALNTLVGLGVSLLVLYAVTGTTFVVVGKLHDVGFGTSAALFLAMASVAGAAMFLAVGALASQLMPTRARAASACAAVFGVCFLVRDLGDISSWHWLLDITPLGWIEKLQPLSGSDPIWLLPIVILILVLSAITVWLAGARDLGDSIFADKDSAKARKTLLRNQLRFNFRLIRITSLSWLAGAGMICLFFGLLTKTATQAIKDSSGAQQVVSRLAHSSSSADAATFLGITFFLLMTVLMSYAASAAGRTREEESAGYLDNLLVRKVSRMQWLGNRTLIAILATILIAFCSTLFVWVGVATQHLGVSFHDLLLAGINTVPPALLTLAIGTFTLSYMPRFTTLVAYSAIAWSFLVQMVSSGINLNHWILDTSILHHIQLAPAISPNWHTNLILVILSAALLAFSFLRFNQRDLQGE